MEVSDPLVMAVTESSAVGEARRLAARAAGTAGFDETAAGRVALVVTELAGNLAKHARGGGELVVQALERHGLRGLEILALDRGPGISNLGQALQDGYSTAGTPGTGLGAVSRLASEFDIHSSTRHGTAVLARVWAQLPPPGDGVEVGAVSIPKPGEHICGDGWAVDESDDRIAVLVADGLGHGAGADEASRAAARAFLRHPGASPAERILAMHEALRSTRGAAVGVAELDARARRIRYAGVGNVAAAILGAGEARNLVSHNGTAGHQLHRVQEFEYPWPEGALLVMHSDGLLSRWSLDQHAGLLTRHPALVAGVLYRDFSRGRDDATAVVVRERPRLEPRGLP